VIRDKRYLRSVYLAKGKIGCIWF